MELNNEVNFTKFSLGRANTGFDENFKSVTENLPMVFSARERDIFGKITDNLNWMQGWSLKKQDFRNQRAA